MNHINFNTRDLEKTICGSIVLYFTLVRVVKYILTNEYLTYVHVHKYGFFLRFKIVIKSNSTLIDIKIIESLTLQKYDSN